jgi:hypothetical protein
LGSGFFQEYTGLRRDRNAKTYDHMALHVDDEGENEYEAYVTQDDALEDDVLEALAAENDEDAILVMQFEDSMRSALGTNPRSSFLFQETRGA